MQSCWTVGYGRLHPYQITPDCLHRACTSLPSATSAELAIVRHPSFCQSNVRRCLLKVSFAFFSVTNEIRCLCTCLLTIWIASFVFKYFAIFLLDCLGVFLL